MAKVANIKEAPGTDLADRDEHPSFSVEALTLAGIIQQNLRNAWLIPNQSESIWDGNERARGNRGSVVERRRKSQKIRRQRHSHVSNKTQSTQRSDWNHRPRAHGKPARTTLGFIRMAYSPMEP